MRTITNWLNVKDNRTLFSPLGYEVIVIIKEQKKRKIISVEKKQGRSQGGNYTSFEQVWANMEKAALEEEY